jgi:hypothetical protein
MSPVASGTDIVGGLRRIKALLESVPRTIRQSAVSEEIWIFSGNQRARLAEDADRQCSPQFCVLLPLKC